MRAVVMFGRVSVRREVWLLLLSLLWKGFVGELRLSWKSGLRTLVVVVR